MWRLVFFIGFGKCLVIAAWVWNRTNHVEGYNFTFKSTFSLIVCMPVLSGCSRVLESVFGPAEGRCRENEQEPDQWCCRRRLFILRGLWERIRGQGRTWRRSGHLPSLHLPRGGQHGVWGAAHDHLQVVSPVSPANGLNLGFTLHEVRLFNGLLAQMANQPITFSSTHSGI